MLECKHCLVQFCPTICSLSLNEHVLPRPSDDICDSPCDDVFVACFEP